MVMCTTTGGGLGMTPEQRVAVVSSYKPELASCNMGSMNFALFPILDKMKEFKFPWEKQYLEFSEDSIFSNTFKSLRVFLNIFNENQTKPELEVYDAGMINNTAFMIERGLLKTPGLHPVCPGNSGRDAGHDRKPGLPLRIRHAADRGEELRLVSLRRRTESDAHVHPRPAHGRQRPRGHGGCRLAGKRRLRPRTTPSRSPKSSASPKNSASSPPPRRKPGRCWG